MREPGLQRGKLVYGVAGAHGTLLLRAGWLRCEAFVLAAGFVPVGRGLAVGTCCCYLLSCTYPGSVLVTRTGRSLLGLAPARLLCGLGGRVRAGPGAGAPGAREGI